MLIDLAVPRDIDPELAGCPGIALYDMDDLQRGGCAQPGRARGGGRGAPRSWARRWRATRRWLQSLDVVPTISALRERGEQIVERVLRENESRWESLSPADRERMEAMARSVVSRLLHEPTLRLKDSVGEEASYRYVHALRELFDLPGARRAPGRGGHRARAARRRRRGGA